MLSSRFLRKQAIRYAMETYISILSNKVQCNATLTMPYDLSRSFFQFCFCGRASNTRRKKTNDQKEEEEAKKVERKIYSFE